MFALLTKAGPTLRDAFYHHAARIISTEDISDKFDIASLFPIWKKMERGRLQHDEIHSLQRMERETDRKTNNGAYETKHNPGMP